MLFSSRRTFREIKCLKCFWYSGLHFVRFTQFNWTFFCGNWPALKSFFCPFWPTRIESAHIDLPFFSFLGVKKSIFIKIWLLDFCHRVWGRLKADSQFHIQIIFMTQDCCRGYLSTGSQFFETLLAVTEWEHWRDYSLLKLLSHIFVFVFECKLSREAQNQKQWKQLETFFSTSLFLPLLFSIRFLKQKCHRFQRNRLHCRRSGQGIFSVLSGFQCFFFLEDVPTFVYVFSIRVFHAAEKLSKLLPFFLKTHASLLLSKFSLASII